MAHTKAGGSTKLGRDSVSKRLGVKLQDGEQVSMGEIIVRQHGTKYHPGRNVRRADDDTLFAMKNGMVRFQLKKKSNFDGNGKKVTFVNVI